jgi:hypothetical protein
MTEPTSSQLQRFKEDMQKISKSKNIEVSYCKGSFYAIGGELEILRIFARYAEYGAVDIAAFRYRVDYFEPLNY